MKKGKIINSQLDSNSGSTHGEFTVSFENSSYGPYSCIFDRTNLYFDEQTQKRGAHFFPLKTQSFLNTEIFLECNDIVVCVGERGSFSGSSKKFIEIVSLKTSEKFRFYPDEVSLIYNTKNSVVLYYKKSGLYKRLELNKKTLEKISETAQRVDAFFKLLYNHDTSQYFRLYYHANTRSHTAGYFTETLIPQTAGSPQSFVADTFQLTVQGSKTIDVWEASLTGEI